MTRVLYLAPWALNFVVWALFIWAVVSLVSYARASDAEAQAYRDCDTRIDPRVLNRCYAINVCAAKELVRRHLKDKVEIRECEQ
jgi:hypothetical protein